MEDDKVKIIKEIEKANEKQLKTILEELRKKLNKFWLFIIFLYLPIHEDVMDIIF